MNQINISLNTINISDNNTDYVEVNETASANNTNNTSKVAKYLGRIVTKVKNCPNNISATGFVLGGFIGSLVGVAIAFNRRELKISDNSSIAITLILYFTCCFVGALYKHIINMCRKVN